MLVRFVIIQRMSTSAPLRLCLVRHGETDWNAARRLQGHLDIPLNPTGHTQARQLIAGLAAHDFAGCLCSDLTRTRQTVAPLLARQPTLTVEYTPALRERHYGCFQGLTPDQARSQHPQDFALLRSGPADWRPQDGGESFVDHQHRVMDCLDALAARAAGQTWLVVTHGGVLDIIYRHVYKLPSSHPRDFLIPNAALNWLRRDADGWQIELWADTRHLQGVALDEI